MVNCYGYFRTWVAIGVRETSNATLIEKVRLLLLFVLSGRTNIESTKP